MGITSKREQADQYIKYFYCKVNNNGYDSETKANTTVKGAKFLKIPEQDLTNLYDAIYTMSEYARRYEAINDERNEPSRS